MADLRDLGFDANEVEPSTGFDPIPSGKYLAVIVESEFKNNKAGTGQYLQLTFEVIEGEYKNRKVWARLNLKNPSAEAVKIARGELSAICRAVGVLTPRDSHELHDLPLVIRVKCKKRPDNDEMTNEIAGYEPKDAAVKQPAAPNQQGNGQKPANQNATPPWKR